jgi:hypothetical protein
MSNIPAAFLQQVSKHFDSTSAQKTNTVRDDVAVQYIKSVSP